MSLQNSGMISLAYQFFFFFFIQFAATNRTNLVQFIYPKKDPKIISLTLGIYYGTLQEIYKKYVIELTN